MQLNHTIYIYAIVLHHGRKTSLSSTKDQYLSLYEKLIFISKYLCLISIQSRQNQINSLLSMQRDIAAEAILELSFSEHVKLQQVVQ